MLGQFSTARSMDVVMPQGGKEAPGNAGRLVGVDGRLLDFELAVAEHLLN